MPAKKKKKKDSQLLIRINREVRDQFIELCEQEHTDAAKQIRRFIEAFIEEHRAQDAKDAKDAKEVDE